MIFELVIIMTPLDGSSPGMRASKLFSTRDECAAAGRSFDQSTKATRGTDLKLEFTCEQRPDGYTGGSYDKEASETSVAPNESRDQSVANIPLWNGLTYGMTKEQASSHLRSITGVVSVSNTNGVLIVKTNNTFQVGGQPSSISLSFHGDSLNRVYILSKPYCVFVSDAGVGVSPPFKIADLLRLKYKLAVDFPGSDKDFTDGVTRVQLRSFSDNRRCGPNELQEHLTLTYLPEAEGRTQDDATENARRKDRQKSLDSL